MNIMEWIKRYGEKKELKERRKYLQSLVWRGEMMITLAEGEHDVEGMEEILDRLGGEIADINEQIQKLGIRL